MIYIYLNYKLPKKNQIDDIQWSKIVLWLSQLLSKSTIVSTNVAIKKSYLLIKKWLKAMTLILKLEF